MSNGDRKRRCDATEEYEQERRERDAARKRAKRPRSSVDRLDAHPALHERAKALRQWWAEQVGHLTAAQQGDVLPISGDAEPPVVAAHARRQPVRAG